MTKLSETRSLAGQTETISLSELRRLPGEVFQQVDMGKVYQIIKNGRTVAWICPDAPPQPPQPQPTPPKATIPVWPPTSKKLK